MEDSIRSFVHYNDDNYSSYGDIKCLFFCVFIGISLIFGTVAVIAGLWGSICAFLLIDLTYLFHMIFLKFANNTYRLRFISEGIIDVLLSVLFLAAGYTVLFAGGCETDILTYGTLIFYLLFIVLYVVITIINSRSYKVKTQKESISKISVIMGLIIPLSGVFGVAAAKLAVKIFKIGNQAAVYIVFGLCLFLSLPFLLGCRNFVKYFYCLKYSINCDHSGNETSDELLKRKGKEDKKNTKQGSNTKVPLILKILIGLISVPVIAFNIILLSVFIKSVISVFG